MKLNYTQRLIGALAAFVFVVTLVAFLTIWVFIETEGRDENYVDLHNAIAPAVLAALEHSSHNNKVAHLKRFDIYFSQRDLPSPIVKKVAENRALLKNGNIVFFLPNKNKSDNVFIFFHPSTAKEFVEEEFSDIVFIVIAVVLSTAFMFFVLIIFSRRLASPVVKLTKEIEAMREDSGDLPVIDRDDEIGRLSHAFSRLMRRVREFSHREQEFTRFASHELRSPITVIRGNVDLLAQNLPSNKVNKRILVRLDNAITRMSKLVEVFLFLGRENKEGEKDKLLTQEDLLLLLSQILDQFSSEDKERIDVNVAPVHWQTNPFLLSILLDNLLRNAVCHSSGSISVSVVSSGFCVSNPITDTPDSHTGIGLQIIQRICEKNNWLLTIKTDNQYHSVDVRVC